MRIETKTGPGSRPLDASANGRTSGAEAASASSGVPYGNWVLLATLGFTGGCATMTYDSSRPAVEVSACIAEGWRKSPASGWPLPVSLTKTDQYYFVGVELHPTFPSPVITGKDHPFYAVWAEVREVPPGSSTRYRRAYQFKHDRIDRVVVDCQTGTE